ncbi:uncharacterized protein BO80DRAFT_436522 [Aspergillus ibericus CBS 121593]|uniref:Uncharacterized protein n=1 Tax=Aspergillus ibericus CBS 121593 TaxID=1448316 RepID=A0A395GTF5_9EURO|nr:hypothetical protein BO80DRAFT_436522 [Aspergillus ibericus CBS 121593]RAK98870.1 hypothetical protein BO80DRAFT_436522 [Aspergillus ibericus CBS 121593]
MSDDEEFYDEYDEDIFWVEEPDPTVADDLAATATATNDFIFYDDPALEAEDFFSDWDDLSDDYYDQDPTVVRRQRALNALSQTPAAGIPPTKRTRKPTTKTPQFDMAAFQGVVWKSPSDEVKIALHEPGAGEKVALLKNWREVFRNSHPAIGRVRVRKDGREWVAGAGVVAAEDLYSDEDEDADVEDGDEDDVEVDVEETNGESNGVGIEEPADLEIVEQEEEAEVNGDHPDAVEPADSLEVKKSKPNGVVAIAGKPATRGRKRKAGDETYPVPEPTNRPRSKRIATQKVGETKESHSAPPSGPVRRSARNKK